MPKSPIIAVVDDDTAMREAISELLQVVSLSSRTFDSAEAFLADYKPGAFDCLVTDLRMPGMGGLDLQRRLNERGSAMPVIVVTSSTDEHSRARAMENGAAAFLIKPINDEVFLRHLMTVLGRHGTLGGTDEKG